MERESTMIAQQEVSIRVVEPDFQELTEWKLQQEINCLMDLVGPGQLATIVSSSIKDSDYLRDFVHQLTANSDAR